MDFNTSSRSAMVDQEEQWAQDLPMTRIIDIAWAAGFADGEACIHISKTHQKGQKNPTYRLVFSVCQNHLGSLRRFARALGLPERFYDVKRTRSMNRDAMTFTVSEGKAYRALIVLLPYLTRKAAEARMAIEAYEVGLMLIHPGRRGHAAEVWEIREWYYRKLRKMK